MVGALKRNSAEITLDAAVLCGGLGNLLNQNVKALEGMNIFRSHQTTGSETSRLKIENNFKPK